MVFRTAMDPLQHAASSTTACNALGGANGGNGGTQRGDSGAACAGDRTHLQTRFFCFRSGVARPRLTRIGSLRAQWLCCSLSYSEPASDRACMRCTHTTCPAVLHLFTAGSVGWNPSHIQPFILQCWIQGELSFYAHCNDPLQHSAFSPTAWQRFRGDEWGQLRYTTGRSRGRFARVIGLPAVHRMWRNPAPRTGAFRSSGRAGQHPSDPVT